MKIIILIFSLTFFSLAKESVSFDQKVKKMEQSYESKNFSVFQKWAHQVLSSDVKNFKALYLLGTYHLNKNQTGVARLLFERGIKHHPHKASLYYAQGLVALKEKERQKAILAFEESLKKGSRYYPAQAALSSLYMQNLNVQKALPLLEDVYLKDSLSKFLSPIAHNYALALRLVGKKKQARKVYKSIIKEERDTFLILINYALLLVEDFDKIKEAQKILNRADIKAQNSRDQRRVKKLKNKLKKRR